MWLTVRPAPQRPPLLVGVDDDTLKWTAYPLTVVRRQQALGARAVRVRVRWNGEARPGAVRRAELSRAEVAARRTDVVLAIFGFGARTPASAAAQRRFCGYAARALAPVPDARAVVVWNETNSPAYWRAGAAAYERLLAPCYDALRAERPSATVLDSTASAHAPDAFLRAVADAYRTSGRRAPLVDGFGHNPYPRTSAEPPDAIHRAGFPGEGDCRESRPRSRATTAAARRRLPSRRPSRRSGCGTPSSSPPASRRCARSGLIWRGDEAKPAARAFASAARSARSGCRPHP